MRQGRAAARNVRHWAGVNARVGLVSLILLSRSRIEPSARTATSTHWSSAVLWLLLNHRGSLSASKSRSPSAHRHETASAASWMIRRERFGLSAVARSQSKLSSACCFSAGSSISGE